MQDQMPPGVFSALQAHLRQQSQIGEHGWQAGEDEEDTLTGHYLGHLQTDRWRVVWHRRQKWRWRIRYKKFASKGKSAPEKLLGADGIVQIEIEDVREGIKRYKGLLFSSKKGGQVRKAKAT